MYGRLPELAGKPCIGAVLDVSAFSLVRQIFLKSDWEFGDRVKGSCFNIHSRLSMRLPEEATAHFLDPQVVLNFSFAVTMTGSLLRVFVIQQDLHVYYLP